MDRHIRFEDEVAELRTAVPETGLFQELAANCPHSGDEVLTGSVVTQVKSPKSAGMQRQWPPSSVHHRSATPPVGPFRQSCSLGLEYLPPWPGHGKAARNEVLRAAAERPSVC